MMTYGVTKAIFTNLNMYRNNIATQESVKQKYQAAHDIELKKTISFKRKRELNYRPSLNDDLESYYTDFYNLERIRKAQNVFSFLTQKLTTEEITLVDDKNEAYLSTFNSYGNSIGYNNSEFSQAIDAIKKSSDTDSIFAESYCYRWTIPLKITLKSRREEIKKRTSNEDVSDKKLKRKMF